MSRRRKRDRAAQPASQPTPTLPSPASLSRRSKWALGALLLTALLLRLLHLGRAELWQDETGFVRMALTHYTPIDIFRASWDFILTIGQLPLAFMIFNAVYHILGWFGLEVSVSTPFWARLPAVLWGVATVWGVFLLTRRVLGESAAWSAAVMVTFFFFPVYYAREAYVYAQIMCLTPFALLLLHRVIFTGARDVWTCIGLVACLLGLLYAHMGALLIVLAMGAFVFCWWVWLMLRRANAARRRTLLIGGVLCGVGLVLASPHLLRFLLLNEAHQAGAPYSLWIILNDGVNKLFLGERLWAATLAWGLFIAGCVGLAVPGPRRDERIMLGSVTLIGLLFIAVATQRSQYLSARYFAPVVPLVYIVFAAGLWWLAERVARMVRRPPIAPRLLILLVAIPLGVHLLVYIPALMSLRYKSVPFGLIADWINEHLEEGTPYVMESAYEIRWVGDAFPTPGRLPVSPYVHMGGPEELARLHTAQQDFMLRFPEAAFIQSAHHNWDTPEGVWTWPHEYFHRRHRIQATDPLRQLISQGIYPGLPYELIDDLSYRIDIYYSLWEDRVAAVRDTRAPVLFSFPGWSISGHRQSPLQVLYFRVQGGTQGRFLLHHVGAQPITGRLQLQGAISGSANQRAQLTIRSPAQEEPLVANHRPGEIIQRDVALRDLPPGEHAIRWRIDGLSGNDVGFIVLDVRWLPTDTGITD